MKGDPVAAVVDYAAWICTGYFLLANAGYLALTVLAAFEFRLQHLRERYSGYDLIFSDPQTPGISIIAPAFNEEVNIELTVKNLLHLDYPEYEVIIVNDGSTDRTLSRLMESFRLRPVDARTTPPGGLPTGRVRGVYYSPEHPGLTVVDKENGGKSDALNAGINCASYGYILSVDADAILEADALLRIIRPVLAEPDRVLAVGGVVRVANGCRIEKGRVSVPQLCPRLLPALQTVEYIRAFLIGRLGMSRLNACPIISGAFGLFNKDAVVAMGGYKRGTVGEDMELIARLHDYCIAQRRDYRIVFLSDPVCWTEVPETLSVLIKQRRRWQRGLLEVLTPRLRYFFRPDYGWLGAFVYPLLFFIESWGTLVEALGLALLLLAGPAGLLDGEQFTALLCASVLLGMSLSIISFILQEVSMRRYRRFSELLRLAWLCIFENLGYRQLNSLIRLLGLWDYLTDKKGWGEMERRGLGERLSASSSKS